MSDNREFINSINNATLKIIEQTALNMKKACLIIEADAKKDCPVDQGPLRASMFSNVDVSASNITGTVANNSETAPYVHQGTGIYAVDGNGRQTPWKYKATGGKYKGWHITRGQHPQPFLEKARDKNKDKVSRILGGG